MKQTISEASSNHSSDMEEEQHSDTLGVESSDGSDGHSEATTEDSMEMYVRDCLEQGVNPETGRLLDEEHGEFLPAEWLWPMNNPQKNDIKPNISVDDLSAFIAGLSPALQRDIYNLTFSFESTDSRRCERHVHPGGCLVGENAYEVPAVLQVSRATRRKAARSYYKNITFHCIVALKDYMYPYNYEEESDNPGNFWLRNLDPKHRKYLREVRVICCNDSPAADAKYVQFNGNGIAVDHDEDSIVEYAPGGYTIVTYGLNGHTPTYLFRGPDDGDDDEDEDEDADEEGGYEEEEGGDGGTATASA